MLKITQSTGTTVKMNQKYFSNKQEPKNSEATEKPWNQTRDPDSLFL